MLNAKKTIPVILAALAIRLVFPAAGLTATPLGNDFKGAPSVDASDVEKAAAFKLVRENLLSAAKNYEGTRYRAGGTTSSGMDCSGLVYRSFLDALGVSVPRVSESIFLWTERIGRGELQPGDLVFFATGSTSRVNHVGIYSGDGRFIHSASAGRHTGVLFSALDEPYWAGVYVGSGRALPMVNQADLP